jgi:putative PIN family toxin of toxin-antitoxin system
LRAVLDPNVVISGLLSPTGNGARLLQAWQQGEFELIASPALLEELQRALAYPKRRRHISEQEAARAIRWLAESATSASDPTAPPPVRSNDPGDDYLIALAASQQAILVSGDKHLLDLAERIPVFEPARFLKHLPEHENDTG